MKAVTFTCFFVLIVLLLCRGEVSATNDANLSDDSETRITSLLDLLLRYVEMDLEDETKQGFQSLMHRNAKVELLMVGLKSAGKTAILNRMGIQIHTSTPEEGFTIESGEISNHQYFSQDFSITSWDLGGQDQMRSTWRQYYKNKQGLIFVVDSSNQDTIYEACDELNRMLNEDELRNAPLLVFANKQDLPGAMNAARVTDILGLHQIRNRSWYIQASSATTGDGLYEGLDWLLQQI